jgi:hypothetical protein
MRLAHHPVLGPERLPGREPTVVPGIQTGDEPGRVSAAGAVQARAVLEDAQGGRDGEQVRAFTGATGSVALSGYGG